jgi:hypothetical protein
MAEYSREESISMANIARVAKLDGEAMKTIAVITLLYLQARFVAVSIGHIRVLSPRRELLTDLPVATLFQHENIPLRL